METTTKADTRETARAIRLAKQIRALRASRLDPEHIERRLREHIAECDGSTRERVRRAADAMLYERKPGTATLLASDDVPKLLCLRDLPDAEGQTIPKGSVLAFVKREGDRWTARPSDPRLDTLTAVFTSEDLDAALDLGHVRLVPEVFVDDDPAQACDIEGAPASYVDEEHAREAAIWFAEDPAAYVREGTGRMGSPAYPERLLTFSFAVAAGQRKEATATRALTAAVRALRVHGRDALAEELMAWAEVVDDAMRQWMSPDPELLEAQRRAVHDIDERDAVPDTEAPAEVQDSPAEAPGLDTYAVRGRPGEANFDIGHVQEAEPDTGHLWIRWVGSHGLERFPPEDVTQFVFRWEPHTLGWKADVTHRASTPLGSVYMGEGFVMIPADDRHVSERLGTLSPERKIAEMFCDRYWRPF